jgi:transcriptional regulator with XRE-family HTH domain
MITQDEIDKIQNLKARRYSQSRVAEKLDISISTVARYWDQGEKLKGGSLSPKKFDLDNLFRMAKCVNCGLVYPNPKFLRSWTCPGCNMVMEWKSCWYKRPS